MKSMKQIIFISLIVLALCSCDKKTYYQGEFIITNDCDEMIDCYGVGKNLSAPSTAIHDRIPAKSSLSYRKIKITDKAIVKDIFESVEIYKNGQKAIKDPMNQDFWEKTFTNNNLTYILVVDSSFFR